MLRRILRRKDGFTIVAECSDGDEVPDAVATYRPGVVVMDLRMKRVDGMEATDRLSACGGPPVLALTTFNDDELLSGALRAGAAGFVLKDSSAEELIRAVRAVARGDSYLDPAVTARVLTTYRKAAVPPTKRRSPTSRRSTCATAPPRSSMPTTTGSLRRANALQSLSISRAIAASSMNASRCARYRGGFSGG
jgi:DNA-binding NarL/FixJ family response regulator